MSVVPAMQETGGRMAAETSLKQKFEMLPEKQLKQKKKKRKKKAGWWLK
jgi:hypothetical protein